MMQPVLTASIVLYQNEPRIITRAIESFLACREAHRLYVIDNSPTNLLQQYCANERITYLLNRHNLGYGRAHNLALSRCLENSTYHIVLNPDVYFSPDVIRQLVQFMNSNHHVGLCMPKVRYPDGSLQPLCKLLPTPFQLFMRRFLSFYPGLLTKLNHEYEMHFSGYNHVMEVPFLSGCFMFLRMEAVRIAGLFDEKFFLYAEDADLSRKIHKHFSTVFYPYAEIYHEHGRGSYQDFRLLLHNILSAIKYFNKWGWVNDKERKVINDKILKKYRVNGYASLRRNEPKRIRS